MAAASASGFAAAYLASHNLSGEYNDATIAACTGVAKEVTYFTSNLIYFSLIKRKNYLNVGEWKEDMKSLSESNAKAIGLSTLVKGSIHYGLMSLDISPENSMWLAYVPAAMTGTVAKFYIDSKNKMFEVPESVKKKFDGLKNRFSKKKKLEDIV